MQAAIAFAFILITSATAATLRLTSLDDNQTNEHKEVRQFLKNREDMLFTGRVNVSGEIVNAIMDTGSFELVLFSKGCDGCEESSTYFDPSQAQSDYKDTDQQNVQSYGSGDVSTVGAYATVKIPNADSMGPLKAFKQLFWVADVVSLDVAPDDTFAGIFGLGPPASALRFAREEEEYVEAFLAGMSSSEANKHRDILKEVRGVVRLEKRTSPFLKFASSGVFSICLLPGVGSNGYVIFNDKATEHITSWIPTVGGGFWEVPVSNLHIGGMKFWKDSCTAIIDSGTSLIGVPEAFYTKITALVYSLVDTHGGCDDLTSWPRFRFKVGGRYLSLPASSYVALYDWDDYELLSRRGRHPASGIQRSFMPHLHRSRDIMLKNKRMGARDMSCEPMVFSMGDAHADENDECEFLFGLPLFRKYYISHKMNASTGTAVGMAFSTPDSTCQGLGDSDDQFVEQIGFRSPVVVKPSKIRFPAGAVRSHRSQLVQERVTGKK